MELPFDLEEKKIKTIYKQIPMWKNSIAKCKNDKDLPLGFKEFVSYLHQKLKTKVKYVSTGPGREDIIVLKG